MYAKVFRQIFESSITEDPELRFTFMDLLVLADSDGVVDMTQESISRITNRPLEVIRRTIAVLEGPDARSRTPDENGARIKRLDDHRDWGWVIINFDKFRGTATELQRKEKNRLRVRKYREKLRKSESVTPVTRTVTPCNAGVTPLYPSPSASVSASEVGGLGEGVSPSVRAILHEGELKRVESQIKDIRNAATVTANGKSFTEAQRAELKRLKDRKSELLKKLDFAV